MSYTVILPWPHRYLSPNTVVHWGDKHKQKKKATQTAQWLCREAKIPRMEGPVMVDMVFEPPTRRRFDLDNRIASMKGALDGISKHIGVDDYLFRLSASMGDTYLGGRVVVTVTPEKPLDCDPPRGA